MKYITKNNYPLIVIILLFIIIYFIGSTIPEKTIRDFVENAGIFGPVLIIFLFWITNLIAPVSGSPLLFAGFYLFGKEVIVYSLIASFIASITNFWVSRMWGRTVVERLAGVEGLDRIDKLADDHGPKTLFMFRLVLWQYHDVISYVFGLTKIGFRQYLLISTIGTIPGALLWWFLASKITNPAIFTILTFGIAAICLASYVCWIKFKKKQSS